ncbi:MAG: leucyl/phenylalanyl-tRNA--protein transferase [Roseovarius sp.]
MKDSETTLTPELLLGAYASGVFPMAEGRHSDEIFWVDPRRRGIFPIGGFHVSRSLSRRLRKRQESITLNAAFGEVVAHCADRDETWINGEIFALYSELHDRGFAHSLEVWREGALAGGIYGVALGAAFFGESMFSRRTDGSKTALAYLLHHLQGCGFTLFDTQFITPHLASLGAVEISRSSYHRMLRPAVETQGVSIYSVPLEESVSSLLGALTPSGTVQDTTQTS